MSWMISAALMKAYENSHCLPAQEEDCLPASCLDGELSARSNGTNTPLAYLPADKMTDFCRLSQSGMTFKPLTESLGADVLTWFLAGSHAKTSALPEKELGLTVSGRECGSTWRASLAKYDPVSSSWKTAQPSLLEDLEPSLVTWPQSGMTRNGECWERPALERRTSVTGCGLWLPTPTAHNAKEAAHPSEYKRNCPTLATHAGGPLNPQWTEWLMGWPIGWTDLKPLETAKFLSVQQKHSDNCKGG